MTKRASFIYYKGTKIYYIDYTHIKTYTLFIEAIDETNRFREQLREEQEKDLLMFVNLTGSFVYGEVLDRLKDAKKKTIPLLKKSAIVGVSKSKRTLINVVNKLLDFESRAFETEEEALLWLIS